MVDFKKVQKENIEIDETLNNDFYSGNGAGVPDQDNEDSWEHQAPKTSVEKFLKAGVIYPTLKPRVNAVYEVQILSLPKAFISKKFGKGYSMNIIYQGMKMNLICSKSFLFSLKCEKERLKLKSEEIPGMKLIFQKSEGATKLENYTTVQFKL